MSDAFVVVMQGDKPTFLGRENLVTIHCQECGQRITESEGAKVTFTRDAQTGDRQSFEILCPACASRRDKETPTSWVKLHEFVEALAESVGMKAERKAKMH
jgi:DNA-directed RNA polymerase subunit RPC12/RpoP